MNSIVRTIQQNCRLKTDPGVLVSLDPVFEIRLDPDSGVLVGSKCGRIRIWIRFSTSGRIRILSEHQDLKSLQIEIFFHPDPQLC